MASYRRSNTIVRCCWSIIGWAVISFALLVPSSMFLSASSGCSPQSGGNLDSTDSPSLGEAEVAFLGDGQTLMTVVEEDGIGSATYEGTLQGDDALLTRVTADTGDGMLEILFDEQQRPTQMTLNGTTVLIAYDSDTQASYQILENGVLVIGGTFTLYSDASRAGNDARRARVSQEDIMVCMETQLETLADAVLDRIAGVESTPEAREAMSNCIKRDPIMPEIIRPQCVIRLVLLTRLLRVEQQCAERLIPPESCRQIPQAIANALQTWDGYVKLIIDQSAFDRWAADPACRGPADDGGGTGALADLDASGTFSYATEGTGCSQMLLLSTSSTERVCIFLHYLSNPSFDGGCGWGRDGWAFAGLARDGAEEPYHYQQSEGCAADQLFAIRVSSYAECVDIANQNFNLVYEDPQLYIYGRVYELDPAEFGLQPIPLPTPTASDCE